MGYGRILYEDDFTRLNQIQQMSIRGTNYGKYS